VSLKGKVVGTRVDWILFYGWPDDPDRVDLSKKGFTNQVDNAVRIFASDFADVMEDGVGRNGWGIGVPKVTGDGVNVTPTNAATVALYIYTPHVRPDKVNIYSIWTNRIGATGCNDQLETSPPATTSTATVLVMDVSGSMGANWGGGVKIESAKSAANLIVDMLQQESQAANTSHRVGLATFTTDATLNLALTSDYNQARTAIDGLRPLANTNIGAGLTVANDALNQASQTESKIVILLSDGLTNTGLPPDQIISGPVQQAANAGTCIYTIGFGDPGTFDKDLLERIAIASGCGQYYYATDVNELQKIYIRVRHVSTGNLLAELSGTVAQGQTVQAGTFDVPTGQDELAVSLNWPGSALDLQLTDPQGKAVDQAYPGANIATYSNLVYALIQKPISGTWQVAVYGREVPEGTTIFDTLASVRPSPVLPTPEPTQPPPAPAATLPTSSPSPAIVVMLAVIAAGGIGVYALVKRQPKRASLTSGAKQGLALLVFTSGSLAGRTTSIPTSGLVIGRGSACNLRLDDPVVSRQHARIRYATGAWFIQDLHSSGGTFVNGQRVQATRLNPSDQIQIGSSLFTFQVKNQ
jgi:Mg-chelatase subunit ChlD